MNLHRAYGVTGVAVGISLLIGGIAMFFLRRSPSSPASDFLWENLIVVSMGILFILAGSLNLKRERQSSGKAPSLADVARKQ